MQSPKWITEKGYINELTKISSDILKYASFEEERRLTDKMNSVRKEISYINDNFDYLDFETQKYLCILEDDLMALGLQLALIFEHQISKG